MGTEFATHEQTVLFGILAIKLGKVDARQWETAAMQTLEPLPADAQTVLSDQARDIGKLLVEQGAISAQDAVTIQGMAAEAVRAHNGDAVKAINSLTNDSDTMQTLASGLFADPRDAATFVGKMGFDPDAKTIALDRDRADAKTFATDSSYAQTIATDSSYAQTIASQPGDLSHANTMAAPNRPAGAAPTILGKGVSGEQNRPRSGSDALPAVPEHEGRYEFVKALSQGGMGQLVIVHDSHLGRDVALKTLLPDRVPGGTRSKTRTGAPTMDILTVPIIARFLQEARIAGQLEHPGIVPAYELGYRADGTIYYTMRLVYGRSLQDFLADCKTLEDRLKLLPHFMDVCNAIAFAHSRGVIHRDLKPLNVMIGEFGVTQTIDWGISKIKGVTDIHAGDVVDRARAMKSGDTQASTKTMEGQAMGSPYYMPPEQAAGRVDEVDEHADIYSLGAILYYYLAGKPPYKEMKVMEFLDKVQSFAPRPIKEQEPEAPAELIAICERAMARKREDRFQTAKALRDEVEKFISGGLVGIYKYSFAELFKRWVKRHWKILSTAAIGLVAFIVLAIASYFAVRTQRDEAIFQRGRAVEEKEHAETELYFADTSLAQRSIEAAQMAAARKQLEDAPTAHRNWEWGHFEQLANQDHMTLEIGGQYVALGPNNTIITGNDRGTISIVDAKTGESKAQLITTAGHGYAFATSADGKRAAMNGPTGVFVWDLETQKQLFTQVHTTDEGEGFPFGISLSVDGSKVAANEPDNIARVWDVASGKKLVEAPAHYGGAYLNPLGTIAVITQVDAEKKQLAQPYDLAQDAKLKPIDLPIDVVGVVKDVVFSPDGINLVIATSTMLIGFETVGWTQTFQPAVARFYKADTLAFSADSRFLAGGTEDGGVLRIDLKNPEDSQWAKVGHVKDIRSVAIASDAGLLFTAGEDHTVHVYHLDTLGLISVYRSHDSTVFDIAVDSGATRLVSASFDATTKVWDPSHDVDRFLDSASNVVRPVAFARMKGMLAMGTPQGVVLADAATQQTRALIEAKDGMPALLAWDPAATRLAVLRNATADAKPRVAIYDTSGEAKLLHEIELTSDVHYLEIAGDASTVVFDNKDGLAAVDLGQFKETDLPGVSRCELSPQGAFAAVKKMGADGKASHISVVQLPALTELGGFDVPDVESLSWSDDGKRVYAGASRKLEKQNEGVLYRWNTDTKQPLPELAGHGQKITAVADNGKVLITGSGDASIIVWDAASGKQVFSKKGQSAPITCLAISPDGSRFVSGSQDGTFKLWDASDGRDIGTIQDTGLTQGTTMNTDKWFAGFTPDGATLAAVSNPPLSPILLSSYPLETSKYPGAEADPFQKRVEQYKRGLSK